jgi:hypothetical protein
MKELDRIANRYIAKILTRMSQVADVPDIVADDVKRQIHFMKFDMENAVRKELDSNGEGNYNK